MFSNREVKIIEAVDKKDMTFQEIADAVFTEDNRPIDDTISIMNSVTRINKKCERKNVPWTLMKLRINGKKTIVKKLEVEV